jgi:hypothetical protein
MAARLLTRDKYRRSVEPGTPSHQIYGQCGVHPITELALSAGTPCVVPAQSSSSPLLLAVSRVAYAGCGSCYMSGLAALIFIVARQPALEP